MPLPLNSANIQPELDNFPTSLGQNFTVIDSFVGTYGKERSSGNLAFIDCHFANRLVANTYNRYFQDLVQSQPAYFLLLSDIN